MKLRIAKKIIHKNANNWEVPYYTDQQVDKARIVCQRHRCNSPLYYWDLANYTPSSLLEYQQDAFLNKLIEQICMSLGIPTRVFRGNEKESLLSAQIHKAEERDRQRRDQYGVPIMQPVLKALQDLKDIERANAEAFWKGAMPPEQ